MSIFSRARRTFKSVTKKVVSAVKNTASKIASVAKQGASAVTAPILQSTGRSTAPKSQPDYTGLNYVEKSSPDYNNMSTVLGPARGGVGKGNITQATVSGPKNIYGDLNRSSRQSTSSKIYYGANSYGGSAPVPSAPRTITGGQRSSGGSSGLSSFSSAFTPSFNLLSGGGLSQNALSVDSGSISSSPSVSLPSAPSYANVSSVTNAGLAGSAAEGQVYDPSTGLFVPNTEATPEQTEEERRRADFKELLGMTPRKESVYEDREVKRQQAEVRERQQEVNNFTAQLNNIVAKRDADLLTLRGIGSEEGVTEAVYGGQAATINREAAIKALPIQAQVAAAQGNLELAQDYLSELTAVKRDQIDSDYTYNKDKFNAISGFLTKEEKIRLDEITKNEDRAYNRAQKNLDLQDEWAKTAIENGQNHLVSRIHALHAGDPDFQEKLGQIIAGIQDKDVGGGSRSIALTAEDRRILAGGGFSANEINSIASDVSEYGIDAVLEGLTDKRQKDAVMKVYGGGDSSTKLTRSTVANFFGMSDNNELSGFLGFFGKGKTNSEKLDELMSVIEKYQSVGYSDEEILKLMKEQD